MFKKLKFFKYFFLPFTSLLLILTVLYFVYGGLNKKNVTLLKNNYDDSILVFAHRGIAHYYPENSFEALQQAKIKNFRAIEIDLNKTSDSVIILFHDNDCERMLGVKGSITSFSLNDLNKHPYLFNGKITSNKVLTLEETFKNFGSDFIIYLDIKNRTYDFMKKVIHIIKKHQLERSTILASAHFLLIARIESDFPEINTCLEGFNAGKEWIYYFIPSDFKPDYYASFIQNVDKKHIDWFTENKLINKKIVYGVDTTNYQIAKDLGIRKVLIDYNSNIDISRILKY